MTLLVARLLFVEREGDEVHLDVVVLERADTPSSPEIGDPLSFTFTLPGDADWREALDRLLRRWAERSAVVHIDLLRRHGRTLARLAVADASLTLEPAAS
jgi:hypothetical protein